ncbi:MAG: hypothetical protein R3310_14425, partial [Candidatus Competibacteraceae bacterium]|nr:hypothetical protein [Candidatus Competibacteraceae bacterium]
HPAAGWLLVVVGGLTAAYATRAWLAGFAGQARTPAAFDAHRAGPWLWLPMAVLALATLLLGLIAIPPLINAWAEWLNAEHPHGYVWTTTLASLVLIASGIGWIWYRFQNKELVWAAPPGAHTRAAYRWFWLVDGLDRLGWGVLVLARGLARLEEFNPAGLLARRLPALPGRPGLIQRLHQPLPRLARQLARFDGAVLSRAVIQGSSRLTRWLAADSYHQGDQRLLDGLLDGLAHAFQTTGTILTRAQSGMLHHYYLLLTLGVGLLLLYALLVLG